MTVTKITGLRGDIDDFARFVEAKKQGETTWEAVIP